MAIVIYFDKYVPYTLTKDEEGNRHESQLNLNTLFSHIKENQLFYKTYFKLCYDDKHLVSIYDTKRVEKEHIDSNLKYHIEFFRNGLNAIIKMWLAGGCQESAKEMAEVLKQEYRGR